MLQSEAPQRPGFLPVLIVIAGVLLLLFALLRPLLGVQVWLLEPPGVESSAQHIPVEAQAVE